MKKAWVFVSTTLILLFLLGCGNQGSQDKGGTAQGGSKVEEKKAAPKQEAKGATKYLTIGTGATGGSYYPVGVGIAKVITDKLPGYSATAEATAGANENLNLLGQGKLDIGFSVTKNAFDAFNARPPFKEKINAVMGWHLFDTPLHMVALKKSGMKTIADLRGKKVAIGAAGSGVNTIALEVLKGYGIGEKDFSPTYMGWDESVDALADGLVDATMVMSAIPSGAVQGLVAKQEITFLEADEAIINKMPTGTYLPMKLPANTYKGQDKEVLLFNQPAYAWLAPAIDEETAYKVIKVIMENKEYLKTVHPMSQYISLVSKSEGERLSVKVHPGVVKYAQEVGAWNK